MSLLLDTSVIIASLDGDEPHHAACDRLVATGGHKLYAHGLAEVFSILSGGRHGRRLRPSLVARLIEDSVLLTRHERRPPAAGRNRRVAGKR